MRKKHVRTAIIALIRLMLVVDIVSAQEVLKAQAVLFNIAGQNVGTVSFEETESGVIITLDIANLSPGFHALHIFENGECITPDFASAGGHFNPFYKTHGFLHPMGPHAGDLPNIEIKDDSTSKATLTTKLVTLKKNRNNSLFKPKGTSVVIHQNPDDYLTNPLGKSGTRLACGVIKAMEKETEGKKTRSGR